MVTCADTSFLFALYGNDSHTAQAVQWVSQLSRPLTISALNVFELGNALRFAECRKAIKTGDAAQFFGQFELDRNKGRLEQRVCNLAHLLSEATRLSRSFTLTGGHRGFDILHVAAAVTIQADEFLTFDANQKRLAQAVGLVVPF